MKANTTQAPRFLPSEKAIYDQLKNHPTDLIASSQLKKTKFIVDSCQVMPQLTAWGVSPVDCYFTGKGQMALLRVADLVEVLGRCANLPFRLLRADIGGNIPLTRVKSWLRENHMAYSPFQGAGIWIRREDALRYFEAQSKTQKVISKDQGAAPAPTPRVNLFPSEPPKLAPHLPDHTRKILEMLEVLLSQNKRILLLDEAVERVAEDLAIEKKARPILFGHVKELADAQTRIESQLKRICQEFGVKAIEADRA
jgi:hypothetical protein